MELSNAEVKAILDVLWLHERIDETTIRTAFRAARTLNTRYHIALKALTEIDAARPADKSYIASNALASIAALDKRNTELPG